MVLSALAAPLLGGVLGAVGGKKGKAGQAAPTTYQSLPNELKDISRDLIFPRFEELFTRPADVLPKRRAEDLGTNPLFASSELAALQKFADANGGAITQQQQPTQVDENPFDGISLADEFIKQLGAPQAGSARGFHMGRGQFSGDLGAQLSSFGDLGSLATELANQGFSRSDNVTPQTIRNYDLGALIRAAQGV